MNVLYNDKTDLLYIRLDNKKQHVVNRRVSEDIVLDIGKKERIIGIEIIDASKHVSLEDLLPVRYKTSKMAVQNKCRCEESRKLSGRRGNLFVILRLDRGIQCFIEDE